MTERYDEGAARRTLEKTRKILNFEIRVIQELVTSDNTFEDTVGSARFLKWLFVALYLLTATYALSGKEYMVAKGVHAYYRAKDKEGEDEWAAYVNTGRTGRIDTDDVRKSLEQLMNRIIIAADAEPLDPKRFFSASQRMEIFRSANGECELCETKISKTNFHADHKRPHSHGGATTVENGQALCTGCNRKKSGKSELFAGNGG